MQTTFAINTDKLDERFLAGVKTMFPHRQVTICVEEELDETERLLANPRTRAALEKSISQADAGELIKFTYEEFLALSQKLHTERAA